MATHRKSVAQYEPADTLTFEAALDSTPPPRKLLSERRRDPAAPELLWRVKVYPGGNGVAGYLALYIEVPARHALPAGWAYARALTFTLHHPTDAARSIVKHTTHTFTAAEPDWGYNQVIPVPALAQRGYLAAGAVRITATFRPVPAPAAPAALRVHTPPPLAADTPAPAPRTPSSPAGPAPLHPGDGDDENEGGGDNNDDDTAVAATALRASYAQEANEVGEEQKEQEEQEQEEEEGTVVEVDVGTTEAFCRASAWCALDAAHEWRLVVCRSPGAAAVSAYVDVRACDAAAGAWAPLTVAVRVRVPHAPHGTHTAPAAFSACFTPTAPRHGVPLLALLPCDAHGQLAVRATASATATPEETPRPTAEEEEEEEEAVDAQTVEVHGLAAYVCTAEREAQTRAGGMRVMSPWRALGLHGRWRLAVHPAGRSCGPAGWVAASVAFRPSPALAAVPGWSLRVLLRANVCGVAQRTREGRSDEKEEEEENEEDTCIAVLEAEHCEVVLDRLVRVRDLVPEGDDEDDGSVLAVRAVLATCGAGAPEAFAGARVVAGATAAVRSGLAAVQAQTSSDSTEGVVPLVGAVDGTGGALCAGVAALERALARQTAALGRLGTSLDSDERLECLRRRRAALQAEKARCLGGSCTAAELDARESRMRAVLKKLMLLQAHKPSGTLTGGDASECCCAAENNTRCSHDGDGDANDDEDSAGSGIGRIALVSENKSTDTKCGNGNGNGSNSSECEGECEANAVDAAEVARQCDVLADRLCALGAECRRVGAAAAVLGAARAQLEQLVQAMPGVVAAERAQREACAQTERALAEECAAVERECRLLRGDDTVLEALTPEHVSACVDFIVEAVGQMAVAKYLTQK